jgi:hypothetical protein
MPKFVKRAVPFNDVRDPGDLEYLQFIYRRSLGLPTPWIGQSRRLFLYIIMKDRKIIDIIYFLVKCPYMAPVSEKDRYFSYVVVKLRRSLLVGTKNA